MHKGRYSLKETCEAVNRCQRKYKMRTLIRETYRNTVKMWNPILPGLCFTNKEFLLRTQAQVNAIAGALNAYRERVETEFSMNDI